MTNITPPRALTPEQEEWFAQYGRIMDRLHKQWAAEDEARREREIQAAWFRFANGIGE